MTYVISPPKKRRLWRC